MAQCKTLNADTKNVVHIFSWNYKCIHARLRLNYTTPSYRIRSVTRLDVGALFSISVLTVQRDLLIHNLDLGLHNKEKTSRKQFKQNQYAYICRYKFS